MKRYASSQGRSPRQARVDGLPQILVLLFFGCVSSRFLAVFLRVFWLCFFLRFFGCFLRVFPPRHPSRTYGDYRDVG